MLVYHADRSLAAKLRRRTVRLRARRAAAAPAKSMISFAFDDAPASAASVGAQILESRGVRGTYYIAAGLAGDDGPMGPYADADAVRRLARRGHEIGCHTYSHLDCGQAPMEVAVEDVARNSQAFAAWGLPAAATFAYPYGDVSLGPKRALAGRFTLLRALHPGLIDRGSDLNQAPCIGLEGYDGEHLAARWLKRAAERGAWVIINSHDVSHAPSRWGCAPLSLLRLIDAALAEGMEVVTVAEGVRRLAQ
jgi:peptidoglycan/xylan/chitin deacetylase (PgdA/CDA1 family)